MDPDHDVLAQGPDRPGRTVPRWVRLTAAAAAIAAGVVWYDVSRPPVPAGDREATETFRPAQPEPPRPRVDPATDAGRPAGLADRASRHLARAMRAFAHAPGPAAGMPWADRVLVLAEGPVDVNRVVSARAADRGETWTDPPYLLAPLATAPGDRLRVDDEHHVTCRGQPRAQAPGFEGWDWVSVQPRVLDSSCRGWWAVDLYLDEAGDVRAVLLRS